MIYRVCPICKAHLDPSEPCDCTNTSRNSPASKRALLITTTNQISEIAVFDGNPIHYRVGEHAEIIRPKKLDKPFCMITDGAGRMNKKDFNLIGSLLCSSAQSGIPIVGDIVIMRDSGINSGKEPEGLLESDISELTKIFDSWLRVLKK